MPRYFLDLPGEQSPRRWEPRTGPHPRRGDTRYFGGVFMQMEPLLRRPELDVYLTWSWERLPAYGDRVVAVVLGDEVGHIPRYVHRVRAVFKCYGTRPTFHLGAMRPPSLTGLVSAAQDVVRSLRWLPSAAAHVRLLAARQLRGRRPLPAVATIPLGTYNQVALSLVPILERQTDVFFAGSVEHDLSLHHRLVSPKTHARRDMLRAARRVAGTRRDVRLDLRVTPSFGASAAAPASDYSRALMDSKVCLAPRGTSLETFRVFEGLRAGCVVVGDRLPHHRFYDGAPLIQLERWSQLERVLPPLLDDHAELERRQHRALEWWRDECSEAAVGRFLAERLNALEP